VGLDLQGGSGPFTLRWFDVTTGEPGPTLTVPGGRVITLLTPTEGMWAAAISE
jgi:hypothetical protein